MNLDEFQDTFRKIRACDIKPKELCGKGAYGKVCVATLKSYDGNTSHRPEMLVACKTLDMPKNVAHVKRIIREAENHEKLHHMCIIRFMSLIINEEGYKLIMELAKSTLKEVLYQSFPIEWRREDDVNVEWNNTKKAICKLGIAAGLCFMHDNNISHRDIKPANILLDENMYPKLADFGFSKVLSDDPKTWNIGSLMYMAPELFSGDGNYDETKVDVYAYGMVLYNICTGEEMAYGEIERNELMNKVSKGQRPCVDDIPEYWRTIIDRCWQHDPARRPTMRAILGDIMKQDDKFWEDEEKLEDTDEFLDYRSKIQDSLKHYS